MTEQELLNLKKEIEESKENLSKLMGRKEALLEQLRKQFGVASIEAAEKLIKKMESEVEEWDQKIDDATEELENILHGQPDTTTQEPTRTGERKGLENSRRPDSPTRRTPR